MNASAIHDALKAMFNGGAFAYLKEFRAGTGYAAGSERYLDAYIVECYPSSPMRRIAIEIKVSRSDFASEIKKPLKRDPAMRISNQFYFAAPAGLLKVAELPAECGLIEVADGRALIVEEAPVREATISLPLFASLARRADNRLTP